LAKLCELGETDAKRAQTLGISRNTLTRYKKEKEFCHPYKKEKIDLKVLAKLCELGRPVPRELKTSESLIDLSLTT